MKGILFITFDYHYKIPDYSFYNGFKNNQYELGLITDFNNDLVESLALTENLRGEILRFVDCNSASQLSKLQKLDIQIEETNVTNLIDTIDTVYLNPNFERIIKYIENNPVLKTKKIVICREFDLNRTEIENLKIVFKDYSNIYIGIQGNMNPVKIDDALKTIDIIDNIVEKINKYNFSPIEQIMYAYDFVRDRIYKEEEKEEDDRLSRDLTAALLGDKIVCAGFSIIFDSIMKKLDINSSLYYLKSTLDNKPKHVRNVLYVKDEKYNIDGVYFFDATWDSKKSMEDNNFLRFYDNFAKTKEFFDEVDWEQNLTDDTFSNFGDEFGYNMEQAIYNKRYDAITNKDRKTINNISKLIDKGQIELSNTYTYMCKYLDDNKDFVIDKLWEYIKLFDKKINIEILLKVIYNVRKHQYYENPEKYIFDINFFRTIYLNSDYNCYSSDSFSRMNKYLEENNLERKIEKVKTLRKNNY